MPTIYRSMEKEDGKPKVGNSPTTLGVRVPPDKNADLPVESDGTVRPNTGGMSVAPAWRHLPRWRISRRLRGQIEGASGSPNVFCWRMGSGPFIAERVATHLLLHPDSSAHGTVEPDRQMPLSDYQGALAATRDQWVIDEE
jgi:hypothetical protein